MAQRRKLAAWSHRASDPARSCFSGVVGRDPFSETSGADVHVVSLIGDAVLVEVDRCSVEGVGHDDVAADVEKSGVYFFDCVGPRYEQVLVATLKAQTPEVVEA